MNRIPIAAAMLPLLPSSITSSTPAMLNATAAMIPVMPTHRSRFQIDFLDDCCCAAGDVVLVVAVMRILRWVVGRIDG
jgi:hypothetical protein